MSAELLHPQEPSVAPVYETPIAVVRTIPDLHFKFEDGTWSYIGTPINYAMHKVTFFGIDNKGNSCEFQFKFHKKFTLNLKSAASSVRTINSKHVLEIGEESRPTGWDEELLQCMMNAWKNYWTTDAIAETIAPQKPKYL